MKIYGHRGAAGHVAENTIASMQRALDLEVDGIEFDVRLSADGVPVVIHDETLDRTTDVRGLVKDYSAAELSSQTRKAEANVFVPTQMETLQAIGTEIAVNVELKELAATEPTRSVLLSAIEQQIVRPEQIIITSFDHDAITLYRSISQADAQQLSVGLLTRGLPDDSYWPLARKVQASSVNIDLGSVDPEFVRRAHARDYLVMVYTVNTTEDAARMRALKVDAIFSDFLDQVRE